MKQLAAARAWPRASARRSSSSRNHDGIPDPDLPRAAARVERARGGCRRRCGETRTHRGDRGGAEHRREGAAIPRAGVGEPVSRGHHRRRARRARGRAGSRRTLERRRPGPPPGAVAGRSAARAGVCGLRIGSGRGAGRGRLARRTGAAVLGECLFRRGVRADPRLRGFAARPQGHARKLPDAGDILLFPGADDVRQRADGKAAAGPPQAGARGRAARVRAVGGGGSPPPGLAREPGPAEGAAGEQPPDGEWPRGKRARRHGEVRRVPRPARRGSRSGKIRRRAAANLRRDRRRAEGTGP